MANQSDQRLEQIEAEIRSLQETGTVLAHFINEVHLQQDRDRASMIRLNAVFDAIEEGLFGIGMLAIGTVAFLIADDKLFSSRTIAVGLSFVIGLVASFLGTRGMAAARERWISGGR